MIYCNGLAVIQDMPDLARSDCEVDGGDRVAGRHPMLSEVITSHQIGMAIAVRRLFPGRLPLTAADG